VDTTRSDARARALRRAAFLLAALAVLTWSLAALGGFHEDDFHSIVENPHLESLASVPRYFVDATTFDRFPQNAMVRPLLLVTFALNRAVTGEGPAGFLAVNALLHLACALFVFLLARELLARSGRTGRDGVALLAAGLFVLHPIHAEAVGFAHGRSDLLSTALLLGATLLFVRGGGGARGTAAAVGVGALAMLAKETAVVLPALFVAAASAAPRGFSPRRLAATIARALPAFALSGLYLVYRHGLLGSVGVDLSAERFAAGADPLSGGGRGILENCLTQAKAMAAYGSLWLWPWPERLSAAHDIAPAASALEPAVLFSLAALSLLVFAAALRAARRGDGLPLALVIFAAAALAPTSSLVPLNAIMAERRLHLASFAIALAAAVVLARAVPGPLRSPRLCAALLAALSVAAIVRVRDFRTEESLWSAAARTSPSSARAHLNLGNALMDSGDPAAAAGEYERAARLRPGDFIAHANAGSALAALAAKTGDAATYAAAAARFEAATALAPDAAILAHKLGRARLEEARAGKGGGPGAYLAAAKVFEGILERFPADGLAIAFLAGTLREAEALDALVAAADRLAARHPRAPGVLRLRAEALLEAGRAGEAASAFRDLAAESPRDSLARRGLALALRALDEPDEAGALAAEAEAARLEAALPGRAGPPAEPARERAGDR